LYTHSPESPCAASFVQEHLESTIGDPSCFVALTFTNKVLAFLRLIQATVASELCGASDREAMTACLIPTMQCLLPPKMSHDQCEDVIILEILLGECKAENGHLFEKKTGSEKNIPKSILPSFGTWNG